MSGLSLASGPCCLQIRNCNEKKTKIQSAILTNAQPCRVSGRGKTEMEMDRRCQRLVKQNSGGVFAVGNIVRQTAVENVGTCSDSRPSAMRRKVCNLAKRDLQSLDFTVNRFFYETLPNR